MLSLRSALVVLVASAIGASANRGLSMKVTGPDAVDGVDKLKVVTTVTNTGDETLKLLNNPLGPLSKMPTNTFAIINEQSGGLPRFNGIKVKYVANSAIQVGGADAFTILAPGQSVAVEHDLSAAYNFTESGVGKYYVEANNVFQYVDPSTQKATELVAEVAEAHAASISGKLAVARPTVQKRATFTGCSSSQQSSLNSAAPAAQTYVKNALAYLKAHTSATTRYTTWFGSYTSSRHTTVQNHFNNMNGNTYTSYHWDCTCTDSGVYAYVSPSDFGHVYLCGAFWSAPTTGTDSKAGTIVHESSHFTRNGGTSDYAYGQSAAKSLAKSTPSQAVMNADSHEYFAENNPALS
ncbi:hypothetical protein NLI96_g3032 [Meripilus lineatus]|uniref:Lysine-specific metallo-endopeptidase domain-containing protein n=1 Tax=Meripilus lineatus TaxID=2056292 RepID=A0AAD5YJG0_9APHY|nr:hypothetical protein NLI96_g3032 [Physisporinus lineatus]